VQAEAGAGLAPDQAALAPPGSAWSAAAIGAGFAGLTAVFALAFLGRYGWDRDELYFLAAAHHLAFGYVDIPPLTALLGRAVIDVFGTSLDALRVATMVIACLSTILVALSVRELGGRWPAQAGAAAAWAMCPELLGSASIFHPTWLDLTCQVAVGYLALRLLVRPAPWVWPALGVVAGVGLEAKYTIGLELAALLVGFLVVRPARGALRGPGPLLAIGLAALIFLPNLIWEAQHGWVSAHFASSQRAQTASDTPPPVYIAELLAFLGAGAPLAIVGGVHLWRRGALRALALAAIIVVAGFGLEQGRAYYPVPALAVCVAAGAVAVERWQPRRPRSRWIAVGGLVAVQLVVIAVAAPLVVPVRSTAGMIQSGVWKNSFFKDEIGWPQMTAQAARDWRALPAGERAGSVVLAKNYGEAGALAYYGPAAGLPQPLSGHLSWQYWRPAAMPQREALTVGFSWSDLGRMCTARRILSRIEMPYRLANEEQGQLIAFCRLRAPLGSMWTAEIANSNL
jgi:hypothetical protein